MQIKLNAVAPALALLTLGWMTTGCNPVLTDLLEVTVDDGATVDIDTICSEACLGNSVPVEISFEEHIAIDIEAEVQLHQYKVEYVVDDVAQQPEYFSDTTLVTVLSGTTSEFEVDLAAASQRDFVDDLGDGETLTGTAIINFAGYDHRDELLSIDVQVPVLWGRFDSSAESTGTGVTQ